jgi:hypothetical protein
MLPLLVIRRVFIRLVLRASTCIACADRHCDSHCACTHTPSFCRTCVLLLTCCLSVMQTLCIEEKNKEQCTVSGMCKYISKQLHCSRDSLELMILASEPPLSTSNSRLCRTVHNLDEYIVNDSTTLADIRACMWPEALARRVVLYYRLKKEED